jgi:RNA polymerase sigma-70 factor (ECF subfamily)
VYDPLGLLLAEEQRSRIRAAVARLHRKDAEILLLKYTEGWSCQELAAHLGATRSAIEARLHRARARLRAELARLDVIEVRR